MAETIQPLSFPTPFLWICDQCYRTMSKAIRREYRYFKVPGTTSRRAIARAGVSSTAVSGCAWGWLNNDQSLLVKRRFCLLRAGTTLYSDKVVRRVAIPLMRAVSGGVGRQRLYIRRTVGRGPGQQFRAERAKSCRCPRCSGGGGEGMDAWWVSQTVSGFCGLLPHSRASSLSPRQY